MGFLVAPTPSGKLQRPRLLTCPRAAALLCRVPCAAASRGRAGERADAALTATAGGGVPLLRVVRKRAGVAPWLAAPQCSSALLRPPPPPSKAARVVSLLCRAVTLLAASLALACWSASSHAARAAPPPAPAAALSSPRFKPAALWEEAVQELRDLDLADAAGVVVLAVLSLSSVLLSLVAAAAVLIAYVQRPSFKALVQEWREEAVQERNAAAERRDADAREAARERNAAGERREVDEKEHRRVATAAYLAAVARTSPRRRPWLMTKGWADVSDPAPEPDPTPDPTTTEPRARESERRDRVGHGRVSFLYVHVSVSVVPLFINQSRRSLQHGWSSGEPSTCGREEL